MLHKLVIASLISIMGTCAFLFRHILKQILIDPTADPIIRLPGEKKKLKLKSTSINDIDAMVKLQVAEAMKTEPTLQSFPENALFLNPLLAFDSFARQARQQQNHNNLYVSAKERYNERRFRSEMMDSIMQPIQLEIYNRGDKTASQMKITLDIQYDGITLYPSEAKVQQEDNYYNRPSARSSSNHILLSPSQLLGVTAYQYNIWKLDQPLQSFITVNATEILPGETDKTTIPLFYIDKRNSGSICIKWHIAESDIGKKGNSGKILIEVEK